MVLGLKLKHKKGAAVKLDCIVHVQEIRPCPPSDSLRSVRTVLLQWDNSDKNSGSFLSVVGDYSMAFNESFMLHLSLKRHKNDKFRKNNLEFSLFEPRKDHKAAGQILGTSVINLADHVSWDEIVTVKAPIKLKKNANGSLQPTLTISLEPVDRDSCDPSTSASLSKDASLDNEDTEFASCTDEDASSHSSRRSSTIEYALSSSPLSEKFAVGMQNVHGNSRTDPFSEGMNKKFMSSNADASEGAWKEATNIPVSSSNLYERSMSSVQRNSAASLIRSSYPTMSFREVYGKFSSIMAISLRKSAARNVIESKLKYGEDTRHTAEEKGLKRLGTILGVEGDKDGGINSISADLRMGDLEKKTEDKELAFAQVSGNEGAQFTHAMSAGIDDSFSNQADIHSGIKTIDSNAK